MPYLIRRGNRLFYADDGEGPPILWHTGGCGDHTMWRRAGYLAGLDGYRHLLFDHRGHGRSDVPDTPDAHHMSNYVDDVIATLDDAGVERAAIVGYSLGARVAYATAMAHPDRVAAVVGLDSIPEPDEDPSELRDAAAEALRVGTAASIARMADGESEPPPTWFVENLCETSTEVFAGAFEAFATSDPFWPAIAELNAPTLLVIGARDDEIEWIALAHRAAAALPAGRLEVLRGLGHLQAFWRVDLSGAPIREFLHGLAPWISATR